MIKKLILSVSMLLCCLTMSFGQDITQAQSVKTIEVKGVVLEEADNQPVLGATILVKGTLKGAASNFDGTFSIYVNLGDILVVSALGYATEEYKVIDEKPITIYLKESIEALDLVTVVGYGVQEKRDLTGSIGSVKSKDIDKTMVSIDNALAGKISGVQVMSSSGVPGSATAITIRGISTLNADSNPLIVIDGVPIYGSNRSNNTTGFERGAIPPISFGGTNVSNPLYFLDNERNNFERNPLSLLNLNDIESIEVLKDAYATAIYGSRGAAGVILITTKKGSTKKPRINFNHSTTFSDPIDTPSVLNAEQYSEIYRLSNPNYSNGEAFPYTGQDSNWLDNVLRTGVTSNYNVSVAANTDKLNYFFSASYLDQEAYIVNQDFKKYSTRLNINYNISDQIKIGAFASLNLSDNASLNAQSIYRNAVLKAPNIPQTDDTGAYFFGVEPNIAGIADNPLAQAYRDMNYVEDDRVIGNLFAEVKPFGWLTLKTEIGIDHYNSDAYSRLISRPSIVGGNATSRKVENKKFVINNTATIAKVFNNIHSINSVLGQSFETSEEWSYATTARDFASDDILDINQGGIVRVSEPLLREWALFSVFGRLNYQYDHKYLAGVTYRLDGSSRFGRNNRYIGFPSFSLGWRASNENFLKDASWLNELKFRGSVGFAGVDGNSGVGGYYGNQGQYQLFRYGNNSVAQYLDSNILQVIQPNNPDLEWERTRTLDLGMDLSLFDGRIDLTVDYYHKKITNLLYRSAVPYYQGYALQDQNIGDMENKGFEITLNTENIKTKDFTWTTNFNISRNTNKILKLNFGGSDETGATFGYKYFKEGLSAGQFFLYDWDGVDALTGNPVWNLPDGTQTQTPPASLPNSSQYRKPMGDALPDFYGGFTNTFTYKNWDLEAFFSFSHGNQLYNGTKALLYTYTTSDANNLSTDLLDYWLIAGHRTDIPRFDNASIIRSFFGGVDYTSGRDSDRFLEDASYLRLKNIKLSYSLPKSILDRTCFKEFAIYVQGNNLLTFTNYSGIDPEVSAFGSSALISGYDELTMPQAKSYSIGINVGF